jgi:uncharacterized protein (TIGR02145 family)
MKKLFFLIIIPFTAATLFAQVVLPAYQGTHVRQFEDCGTITDLDGNVYPTIVIGTQCYFRKNLQTTKYNDGTLIPNVTDQTTWSGLTSPAYCWYENDYDTYGTIYGALYNWYAVNTGKLCPTGWHVPSKDEWMILTTYLGGLNLAGGKLKASGLEYWDSPNTGATNEVGFNGLPGGMRGTLFTMEGKYYRRWSSTNYDATRAYQKDIIWMQSQDWEYYREKYIGMSVRCIKN